MPVPVYWITNHLGIDSHGPWDTRILDRLFAGHLWPHRWEFEHHYNVDEIQTGEVAVVVLPSRHHARIDDIRWLNEEMLKLTALVLVLAGDEEGIFPWNQLVHPNCRIWIQHPNPETMTATADWAFFYGCGSPSRFSQKLPEKTEPWVFAGQVTHMQRKQARDGLVKANQRIRGVLEPTHSFAAGLPPAEYSALMASAKVAPAPSGPKTPDTFRFYEALEAGAWPIVDSRPPYARPGYWPLVYGDDFPFTVMEDWDGVGGHIEEIVKQWPEPGNVAMSWWLRQRRRIVQRLDADLIALKAEPVPQTWKDLITIVVTTSPIPSHPDTFMFDETIDTLRRSMGGGDLPQMVVVADGVREEQEDLRGRYGEYIRALSWRAMHQERNMLVLPLTKHRHQIRATQSALAQVTTPLILFMEHDTPFTDDPIDWETAVEAMAFGALDVLRFHHESQILPTHEYLMIDKQPMMAWGLPVQRTRQWSQRPHIANADYYRRMLTWVDRNPNNGFIEDAQYTEAIQDYRRNRIGIYAPEGTLCRTYHLDGREGGPKFDDRYMT